LKSAKEVEHFIEEAFVHIHYHYKIWGQYFLFIK